MMGPGMFGGCCGGWGGYGAFGWIGLVFNLLIVVAVIWLIVWAIKRFTGNGLPGLPTSGGGSQSAREILQTRYARGEITREQYREMLKDLEG